MSDEKIESSKGGPLDSGHRDINPLTGQQKDYAVLSVENRKKGFIRPVRRTYLHLKCNTTTTMSQAIAETYARDPKFYDGTFCIHCKGHFPVGEDGQFVWVEDINHKVGT